MILAFNLNLPVNGLANDSPTFISLCFKMEKAHWFYLDEYVWNDATLQRCSQMSFFHQTFSRCSNLQWHYNNDHFDDIVHNWKYMKNKLPSYGAIILNENKDKVLMVQCYHSKTWGFPLGKAFCADSGQEEDAVKCAVREVDEEISLNISNLISNEDYIEKFIHGKKVGLFIIKGRR